MAHFTPYDHLSFLDLRSTDMTEHHYNKNVEDIRPVEYSHMNDGA